MGWKIDKKRYEIQQKETVKCDCGHSILTAKKYKICSYCGKKVSSHKEQFKRKLLERLKNDN